MTDATIKAKSDGNGGYWFFVIFGMFFLLPGLFMAGMQVKTLSQSIQAKNWDSVPAIVQEKTMKYHSGSEGGTTYRATGSFKYEYQGKTYLSERLFFGSGYDSDKKYHRNVLRELGQRDFEVKVNPKRPDQAVAFPGIRWKMQGFMSIFSVLFSGVGGGIVALALFGKKSEKRENKRALQFPDEPWRWRDIWQTRKVKNSSKSKFYAAFAFAAFWNLISWPIVFPLMDEVRNGEYWLIVFLSFPIIGLFLMFLTWKYYRNWKRFGRSFLQLETYPAAIGASFMGVLHVPGQPPDGLNFHIRLSCIREEEQGSGDDRKTVENILWQDEQVIPSDVGRFAADFELPIQFAIPADAKVTSIDHLMDRAVLWRISAAAESGNVKYDEDFEVPVFDPKDYRFHIPIAARQNAGTIQNSFKDHGNWQRTGVIHTDNPNGGYYYFPAGQHKDIAAMLSLMTLVFGGVAVAPFFSDIPVVFSIFFGLGAALVGFFALCLWLYKSAIDVRPGEIIARRGLWNGKIEQINSEHIKSIELNSSMSSGDVKYYDIIAILKSGKKLKLATNLLGKRDVEALISRIKNEIGIAT